MLDKYYGVVLDCETTRTNDGWPLAEAASIAVTSINGETLFNSRVRPLLPIDPGATAVHGITDAEVAEAPTFAEILPDLMDAIDAAPLWIYNRAFDMRVLIQSAYMRGATLPLLIEDVHCAMLAYSEALGLKAKDTGQYINMKLGAAHELQFGHVLPAHDALADCLMTANLVKALIDGAIMPADFGAAYEVTLVEYTVLRTYKGDPYVRYTTEGGLNVNLFSNQFHDFPVLGAASQERLVACVRDNTEGDTFRLMLQPAVYIKFEKGYPVLKGIAS